MSYQAKTAQMRAASKKHAGNIKSRGKVPATLTPKEEKGNTFFLSLFPLFFFKFVCPSPAPLRQL